MSLPATLLSHVEIIINGVVSAAGSNSKASASVWHYRRTTTVNVLAKTPILQAFITSVLTPLVACLSVRHTTQNVTARFYDDPTDAVFPRTSVLAGAITGDSMPTANSVFLLMGTGLRGKNFRGSKKLFPIGESATTVATDDILNAGALTYFGTLASAALASFTDSNGNVWIPQVLSRKLSNLRLLPQASVVANDVTIVSVRKTIGHMRRRQTKSVY